MKNRQRSGGFSLVELLTAIALIGILTSVAAVSWAEVRKNSRDRERMTDLRQLELAIELYYQDHGYFPARGCGVSAGWTGPGPQSGQFTECDDYIDGLTPDYIRELPRDPLDSIENADTRGIAYTTTADQSEYKIMFYRSVENIEIEGYSQDFARCPEQCGSGACSTATAPPTTYALYTEGLACQ